MSQETTPGVHVKEVATLPASVAQVATAIPAFIGYTESGGTTVAKIGSMADFVEEFGGPDVTATINITSNALTSVTAGTAKYTLYYCMQHYFANGGGDCYVASCEDYKTTPLKSDYSDALALIGREDEPTMIVLADAVTALGAVDYHTLLVEALTQCNTLGDRVVIMDTHKSTGGASDVADFRNNTGMNYLKYGAAYYPHLKTAITHPEVAIDFNVTTSTNMTNLGAVSSPSLAGVNDGSVTLTDEEVAFMGQYGGEIAQAIAGLYITLPPSAAMAGIYAATDRNRGVWKAPANVSVAAVIEPTVRINDEDQKDLNVDATSGKSVNAIRSFTGKGTLVWGARTLAGNDSEWRYVPVRRLYNTVEESVKKATEFVVFEPNDANTWTRTKAMIENYLRGLWRDGALAGAKPEDAFFVNVGLGETMDSTDILEGRLIIEIGMAAVRPAEFIILRFSHKLQES